jgi:hypothetical protein
VAASGVDVMGKDWLVGKGHGGEKLSSFLICALLYLFVEFFLSREEF